jgi:hypothetical protein
MGELKRKTLCAHYSYALFSIGMSSSKGFTFAEVASRTTAKVALAIAERGLMDEGASEDEATFGILLGIFGGLYLLGQAPNLAPL